jgi:hypothetical protein
MAKADNQTITRRTAIALAAGVAATAMPAAAASVLPVGAEPTFSGPVFRPDPIFLVINRHRLALDVLNEALVEVERAEAKPRDQARLDAAYEVERKLGGELSDMDFELASTVPASIAGILAAIEYERHVGAFGSDEGLWATFVLSIETGLRDYLPWPNPRRATA